MKINFIKNLCFVLAGLMTLSLVACGPASTITNIIEITATPKPTPNSYIGEIEFVTKKSTDEKDMSNDSFIQQYNLFYPDVKVKLTEYSAEEYYTKLNERLNSNTPPDVFWIEDNKISEYVASQKIVDLTKYWEGLRDYSDGSFIKPEVLFPAAFDAAKKDGKLYIGPIEYERRFILMNVSMFNKKSITLPNDRWVMEDFKKATEALSSDKITTGAIMDYYDYAVWGSFARGYGGSFYDQTTKTVNLTDEKVMKGLSELAELVKSGAVKKIDAKSIDVANSGMILAKRSDLNKWLDILTPTEGSSTIDWELIQLPKFDVKSVGANTSGFAVSSKSESIDIAASFAMYTLTNKGETAVVGDGERVPSLKAVAKEKFWREKPVAGKNTSALEMYAETADFSAVLTSVFPENLALELSIGAAIDSYVRGEQTLNQALLSIQDKANAAWK